MRQTSLLSVLLALICLAPLSALHAQQVPADTELQVDRDVEQILEEFSSEDVDADPEELIRSIRELAANPLNVNRASVDELMQVPRMTWQLAHAIVEHRHEVKPFGSAMELSAVRGIGPVTRDRFLPYLSTGSAAELRRDLYLNPKAWVHNGRGEVYSRFRRVLATPDGYAVPADEGGYVGNPVNYYQRIYYRSDHLTMNLSQMKRPGEPLPGPTSFDHQTLHASIGDLGRLRRVVVGDFSLRFGQGLIMGSSSVMGKAADVIRNGVRSSAPLRGYTSSSRTPLAFRGIATSWGEQVEITTFFSSRRRTAAEVDGDSIRYPSAYPQMRTIGERERMFNTRETTLGGRIRLELPGGLIGASGWFNHLDRPVQRGSQPWHRHDMEGSKASAFSLDYRITTGSVHLYGEAGLSGNGAPGVITGLETSAGDDTEFAFIWRHYDPSFQSLFGNSFSELSGSPANEEGWYLGVRHRLGATLRISAFFDQFRFPAPHFRMRRPGVGHEWLGLIEYLPERGTDLHLQIRQQVREQEYTTINSDGVQFYTPGRRRRLAARLHAGLQVHPRVRLRSRLEWLYVEPAGASSETAFMIWQDIRFRIRKNLQVDARVTLFDTDGFESRLYHFENDLLHVFASTMLFDQGQRLYLLLNYDPAERIRIWLKLSTTIYENRTSIGSGRDHIPQSHRSDIGLQVRVRI